MCRILFSNHLFSSREALQLVSSNLLALALHRVWSCHQGPLEIVSLLSASVFTTSAISTSATVLTGPAYSLPPTIRIVPGVSLAQASTIISGPTAETSVVKGAGPVTITGSRATSDVITGASPLSRKSPVEMDVAPKDPEVLIKGPAVGPVILIGPSEGTGSVKGQTFALGIIRQFADIVEPGRATSNAVVGPAIENNIADPKTNTQESCCHQEYDPRIHRSTSGIDHRGRSSVN